MMIKGTTHPGNGVKTSFSETIMDRLSIQMSKNAFVQHIQNSIFSSQFVFEVYNYPDIKFNEAKEVKLLNKLIAEKPQKVFFKEGFYKFHRTDKIVPQALLDKILSIKK